MNYTLHLTDSCNLNCKYCYETKKNADISFENIKLLIDSEIDKKSKSVGLNFYGGEPLLKKDFIYDTINYIKSKKSKTKFYFGITTNGTLLDKEFIDFVNENNFLHLAYSFDGKRETQDLNRVTASGKSTFDKVEENAKMVLENYKSVVVMMVATKNNISNLAENVEYLIGLGFKSFNILFDYLQDWEDEDLAVIKEQYNKVAEIYYNKILNEEDINILAFDEKIFTYIKPNYNCNEDCNLGTRSVNVGTDGNYYPCVQFVGNEKFIIGNCKDGVKLEAVKNLLQQSGKENEICKICTVRNRCKHTCACKNFLVTKDINQLSPIVCELEKIIIDASDRMAERLYNKKSKLFLQKYYNKNYSVINGMVEKR